jgi:hypothetical protein
MHASKLLAQTAGGINLDQSVNATLQPRQPLQAAHCGVAMIVNKRHQQKTAYHGTQGPFNRIMFSASD